MMDLLMIVHMLITIQTEVLTLNSLVFKKVGWQMY